MGEQHPLDDSSCLRDQSRVYQMNAAALAMVPISSNDEPDVYMV